jgi:hypothetical protein
MLLSDVCTFDNNNPHFYVDRDGMSYKKSGPGRRGIRVTNLDKVVPDYLFYMFQYLHSTGVFQKGVDLTTVILVDRPQTIPGKQ